MYRKYFVKNITQATSYLILVEYLNLIPVSVQLEISILIDYSII